MIWIVGMADKETTKKSSGGVPKEKPHRCPSHSTLTGTHILFYIFSAATFICVPQMC